MRFNLCRKKSNERKNLLRDLLHCLLLTNSTNAIFCVLNVFILSTFQELSRTKYNCIICRDITPLLILNSDTVISTPHWKRLPIISGGGRDVLTTGTCSETMTSSMTSQPLLGDGRADWWLLTRGLYTGCISSRLKAGPCNLLIRSENDPTLLSGDDLVHRHHYRNHHHHHIKGTMPSIVYSTAC